MRIDAGRINQVRTDGATSFSTFLFGQMQGNNLIRKRMANCVVAYWHLDQIAGAFP
jgi:hypothetical protein